VKIGLFVSLSKTAYMTLLLFVLVPSKKAVKYFFLNLHSVCTFIFYLNFDLEQSLDFLAKFPFLINISIFDTECFIKNLNFKFFVEKFQFWQNVGQKSKFWPKIWFFVKISISDQRFVKNRSLFGPNIWFLVKISISDQRFVKNRTFWQKT